MNVRTFRMLAAAAAALLAALALAAPAGAAPTNDEIANAQVLPQALPVSVPGTTVGATGEPGEKVFGNEAKASVWFSWKASVTGTVVVDLCGPVSAGGDPLTGVGVYTGAGTTWASLTKVTDTTGPCKLRFGATAGTTYKIQVDYLFAETEFVLGLHLPQPPANDNFASAQAVAGLPFSVSGSTIEATFESGEPAALGGSGNSRSVWYSWTAPSSGHVQLSGCPFETQRGSAANMKMAVYTGTTLAGLTNVVETTNCKVEFDAVSGTNYKIAFSGDFSGEGTFTLAMRSAPPPANDNFAAAQTIGPQLPLAVTGDDSFATTEAGESTIPPIGGISGSTHSVWYQWTPTVTELVKVNACGDDAIPRLGVYEGATLATLKAANLPLSFAPFCAAELEAKAGVTYKIAIAGGPFEGSTGPFELEIHRVSRPANDNFAAAQTIGPALPIAVDGNNADATVETGEVHPAVGLNPIATVWYRWESPLSGPVDISTCGSATDDFAAVHTGGTLATLTRIVPSGEDDPGACPDPEQKGAHDRFTAVAGTTYWIQVSSPRDGIEGPFHLTITDPNAKPPATTLGPNPGLAPGPAALGAAPKKKLTLSSAIKLCHKRYAGKGKKVKAKRAGCITKAKRKFALAACGKLAGKARQERCVKAVRKKYS